MSVVLDFRVLPLLISIFALLLFVGPFVDADQSDIDCLKSIKDSLQDPLGYLSSWKFTSTINGFICSFVGIQCWHDDENRVLNIRLSDMGLRGEFPLGIASCKSLTGLDLSSNDLGGTIPSNISNITQYVTTLDLSSNQFSGEIPASLANCSFLNTLKLDNNKLTGGIPPEIGLLDRMKTFTVSGNRLSGPVPRFRNSSILDYSENNGLCGDTTLPSCQGPLSKTRTPAIVGAAVSGATIGAICLALGMYFYTRKMSKRKKEEDPLGNKWARSIKGTKKIKISMFGKPVSEMNLNDLMKATNEFSRENIIGSGRTGTLYKAILEDGTSLMVKRLQDTQHTEKEFMSEMETLGRVKHRNLVPLLGFCMTKKEHFLIYELMPNGTLHDKLHNVTGDVPVMEWPLRLKIGIRAAEGFACLHHTCNPRIIHRNISSKCILLDADYEPKISDFGLARLMNPIDTHLSTFVNGEFGDLGYVAPEYARTLVATLKGDVYSFGVVLLELVTGEKPTHVSNAPESFKGTLVEWISQLSAESKLRDAIDMALVGKGFDREIFQLLKVACRCVLATTHKERPTMYEVYQLIRAIGQRYSFTREDDILAMPDAGDGDEFVELIVAKD